MIVTLMGHVGKTVLDCGGDRLGCNEAHGGRIMLQNPALCTPPTSLISEIAPILLHSLSQMPIYHLRVSFGTSPYGLGGQVVEHLLSAEERLLPIEKCPGRVKAASPRDSKNSTGFLSGHCARHFSALWVCFSALVFLSVLDTSLSKPH